jgi:hypothetical protein
MKEKVEEAWKKYNDYKETAEQHMFPKLVIFDRMLEPAYKDLQEKWSDVHAQIFLNGMNIVFKKLGI